jgi:hypothetical protein
MTRHRLDNDAWAVERVRGEATGDDARFVKG